MTTALHISPNEMKSLLATYATHQTRSVKSHLGDRKGSAAGSCVLTVGIILANTPAEYRNSGESVLQRWCDARALESEIENAIATIRSRDRSHGRIERMEYQRQIVVEHTYGIEVDPLFKAALCWAAADLERRLSVVSNREMLIWLDMLGG